MSKSSVSNIISDVKALADYNVTDSSLDSLIVVGINFALKRMKQWFMDEQLFDEISAHGTFTTTADQEYIDLASETTDFDQPIKLTERTNDSPIEIISFKEYRERYTDPTETTSQTPDVASFFANRIYLGPTPSGTITLYLDYIKLITKVTSSDTLPFEDKYDELVVAIALEHLFKFMDRKDQATINSIKQDVLQLKHDLIVGASKNVGMISQSQSRREEVPYFSPKKVIS